MKFKRGFLANILVLFIFSCTGGEKGKRELAPPTFCNNFITLGPSITELVIALKAENRLLAVSRYDDRPEVAEKPRVGGILDPEIERIAALNPACLFYIPSGAALEMRLNPLRNSNKTKVLPIDIPNIKAIPKALNELGQLLHLEDKATELQHNFELKEKEVDNLALQKGAKLRAVTVYGLAPLVVAGRGSMGHELMTLVGFENPVKKENYPVIDEEYFLSLAPDIVFDMSHQEGGARLKRLIGPKTRLIILNDEELRHPALNSLAVWQKRLKELGF